MNDPRIGTYDDNGGIAERPTQTLSGLPARRPYAAVTRLDATHFVVQDAQTPRGYDVEAAIKRLKRKLETGSEDEAAVEPAARRTRRTESAEGSNGATDSDTQSAG